MMIMNNYTNKKYYHPIFNPIHFLYRNFLLIVNQSPYIDREEYEKSINRYGFVEWNVIGECTSG